MRVDDHCVQNYRISILLVYKIWLPINYNLISNDMCINTFFQRLLFVYRND